MIAHFNISQFYRWFKRLITLLSLLVAFSNSYSQQPDTTYILFKVDSVSGCTVNRTKLEPFRYPQDASRTFNLCSNAITLARYGNLPDWTKESDDYFLANNVFLQRHKVYRSEELCSLNEDSLEDIFHNKNQVIYLAEESRYEDGYYTFIRVYYQPFTYE